MRDVSNTATDEAAMRSDADLIADSFSDPEPFGVLFDRHFDSVHRYLSRRVGTQLADDLVGETFAVAFKQRRRYDVDYPSARGWLLGISTNLLRRHHRQEVRAFRAWARTGVDPVPDDADQVGADVDAAAEAPRLAAALAGLSSKERDVVLLIAWCDLTYAECAVALGIPIGTVRSRLSRARAHLRVVLGPALLAHPEQGA